MAAAGGAGAGPPRRAGWERYDRVRLLGKGNMGTCWLVRSKDDGRLYVLKTIDMSTMGSKDRSAAMREAKLLSNLRHPNIIRYVDSFLSNRQQQLNIVMEYAEGGDLAARIKACRGQSFKTEQVLDWFLQICLAVHYIHSKRVLHRDVKTLNIFLTGDGVVKVGDFGISRVLANTMEMAHTFVGTPYYLSPELVQEKPYNAACDMWALGVVLYELMSLRHPFEANGTIPVPLTAHEAHIKTLMRKIVQVMYSPLPGVFPFALRDAAAKLLTKDPRLRIRIGELLNLDVLKQRLLTWFDDRYTHRLPASYMEALSTGDKFVMALLARGEHPPEPVPAARPSGRPPVDPHPLPRLRPPSPLAGMGAAPAPRRPEVNGAPPPSAGGGPVPAQAVVPPPRYVPRPPLVPQPPSQRPSWQPAPRPYPDPATPRRPLGREAEGRVNSAHGQQERENEKPEAARGDGLRLGLPPVRAAGCEIIPPILRRAWMRRPPVSAPVRSPLRGGGVWGGVRYPAAALPRYPPVPRFAPPVGGPRYEPRYYRPLPEMWQYGLRLGLPRGRERGPWRL